MYDGDSSLTSDFMAELSLFLFVIVIDKFIKVYLNEIF